MMPVQSADFPSGYSAKHSRRIVAAEHESAIDKTKCGSMAPVDGFFVVTNGVDVTKAACRTVPLDDQEGGGSKKEKCKYGVNFPKRFGVNEERNAE
ncbi:MAG TPA: hypothetical protein VGN88_09800 [Phycisphaerae bacterium]